MGQIKIKKPKAICFDITGTVARESFVEKTLLPYFSLAYNVYLENNWTKPECQDCVKQLAKAADQDQMAPKIASSGEKKNIISQVCKYIDYCLEKNCETRAFAIFRFHVWFDGYDRGKLTTPVYSDVAVTLQKWKSKENINLYILSNGWTEASKKFMAQTSHGDLNLVIDEHFDTSLGSLHNSSTFVKFAEKINQKPEDVLFLTKSAEEGKAAQSAGFNVILVLTRGSAVDAALKICKDIPIARIFTDIDFI